MQPELYFLELNDNLTFMKNRMVLGEGFTCAVEVHFYYLAKILHIVLVTRLNTGRCDRKKSVWKHLQPINRLTYICTNAVWMMNDLVQHVTDDIVKEQSIEKLFSIIFLDILGRYYGK